MARTRTRSRTTGGDDWQPAWSPDGSTIAFLSGRDGTVEVYAVSIVRRRGRRPEPVASHGRARSRPGPGRRTARRSSTRRRRPSRGGRSRDADPAGPRRLVVWTVVLTGLVLVAVAPSGEPAARGHHRRPPHRRPPGWARIRRDPHRRGRHRGRHRRRPRRLVPRTPGPTRPRAAWLLGALLPATWTAAYLAAVSDHGGPASRPIAVGGAVVLSAIVGLLMAVVIVRDRPPVEHAGA